MNRQARIMIIITICLLFLLIIKSTLVDPKTDLTGDMEVYGLYMLSAAPLKGGILEKTGLLTYRVVQVKQDNIDRSTRVMIRPEDSQEWTEHTLEGEYSGKVRAYLFYFIPIRDINFKGGILYGE